MKIEDIQDLWFKDSDIDRTELGHASLNIPKLHHKYFKLLSTHRMRYQQVDAELKTLRVDCGEMLMGILSVEELKYREWEPFQGKVLRVDLKERISAYPDVVKKTLLVGLQREKVDFLISIISFLSKRNFEIKNAIDWEKFKHPG